MNLFSIKIDTNISCYIISIFNKQFKIKSKKLMLKNIEKKLQKQELLLQENLYAQVWKDTIINSDWFIDKSVTPTKGAANYSFLLLLYKVLNEIKPENILEFGLGQISLITSQYIKNACSAGTLDIVEHDADWINYFKFDLTENIKIHKKNIIKFTLNGIESDKYEPLDDIVYAKKYNLIVIDGPFGYDREYPRTNILDIIPQNLADDFAIILDDYDRIGEQNTASLMFNKLKGNGIDYICSVQNGLKQQLLITDSKNKFIHRI